MTTPPHPPIPLAAVAVHISGAARRFVPTVRSLAAAVDCPLVIGLADPQAITPLRAALPDVDVEVVAASSVAALVNDHLPPGDVLVVTQPVVVSPDFLDVALEVTAAEPRFATVDFLTNSPGPGSFPHDVVPPHGGAPSFEPVRTTHLLRTTSPHPLPVPIPFASSIATLLTATGRHIVGRLDLDAPSSAAALADFSLRAQARGLLAVLDTRTYVDTPSDLDPLPTGGMLTDTDIEWLEARRSFALRGRLAEQRFTESALSLGRATARVKVTGLRVLIDGSSLGPHEMGTQVALLACVRALAARSDVAEICVAINDQVPPYAAATLGLPRVRTHRMVQPNDPTGISGFDVVHRPNQADPSFNAAAWRRAAPRLVISVLDLIGYEISTYQPSESDWLTYRARTRTSATEADAVVVISEDVKHMFQLERIPIDSHRLFAVPLGAEHLAAHAETTIPEAMRGREADRYLFCLGTNYTHKNRDLAILALRELRARGHDLTLVLAGTAVPHGTTRVEEAVLLPDDHVVVLPGIPATERNWLLAHAEAVLYPTSAEGFGLVPFEAAQFETPCVAMGFGPLTEVGGALPVMARTWSAEAFADATEELLADPAVARAQVDAARKAGTRYTWAQTAEDLVTVYRFVMSHPPVPTVRS